MLNHATRYNWHAYQDGLRPSVLGRAAGRGTYALRNKRVEDDADEAVPSRATHEQMHAYLDARHGGDEWGQHDALNKIAQLWRADNAAGGVPVHAHLPLPKEFAKTLARLMSEMGETQQQQEFDGVVTKLEPSLRTLVSQQLAALMERVPTPDGGVARDSTNDANAHFGFDAFGPEPSVFHLSKVAAGTDLQDDLSNLLNRIRGRDGKGLEEGGVYPLNELALDEPGVLRTLSRSEDEGDTDAAARGANWRTMEYSDARDGPVRTQTLPWDNESEQFQRAQLTDGQGARLQTLENDARDRVHPQTVGYSRDRDQSDIRVQPTTVFQGRTSDGGYFIRRNFKLSRPADPMRGGYIVQTVRVTIQDVGPDGRRLGPPRTYEYSEAWRVAGGKDRPLQGAQGYPELGVPWANDSIGGPPQDKVSGVMTVTVTTRFYDGMTHLPDDFQQGTVVPAGPYVYSTITPFDELQFDGLRGPATTTSFPPILLKRKGQR